MAENSKIEWTDHTFNPWIGCTKVSDGCKHCYAEAMMDTRMGKVQWGPEGTRVRTSAANWKKPLKWNTWAAAEGRRYKVFCASLADVFEDRAELVEWRNDLFSLIYKTPNLEWLLLTKRPENVMSMVPAHWLESWPSHVWLGTSVENQEQANKRIPKLLGIPAAVRFLSMEPLLGPVRLMEYHQEEGAGTYSTWIDYLDWVIVGGESGPGARPMHPGWARSIRNQCLAAGVAFHFKQWGEWRPADKWESFPGNVGAGDLGRFWQDGQRPTSELLVRAGKAAAGRILDGRTWDEFPQAVTP